MEEEFKEIIGYEGLYWVSNLGNVKSKRKQLKICLNVYGYPVVNLSKEGKMKTFITSKKFWGNTKINLECTTTTLQHLD